MPAETVPCPGCAAPMLLDQEVCAACRRPRDEFEIAAGREAVEARARAWRALPRKLALGAAVAGAAYAAYQARAPVLARVARERADMAAEMERIADPAKRPGGAVPQTEMGKRLVAALARPSPADGDAPAPSATIRTPATRAAAPSEAAEVEAAAPPAQPRPAGLAHAPGRLTPPYTHKVYGVLYDFATGLTVPGAELYVQQTADSGPPAKGPTVLTDADGYFEADFGDGTYGVVEYSLVARRQGADLPIIEESDPPYRERTQQMLREDLAAIRLHDRVPVVLRLNSDEIVLHRDLVVLPPDRGARKR